MIPDIADTDYRPDLIGWSQDILPYYRDRIPKLPDPAVFVELGVAHGRSLLFFAEELHKTHRLDKVEVWGIDSWGGDWFEQTIVKTCSRKDLAFYVQRLRVLRLDVVRAARLFDDESIDMCFIDADHSYEGMVPCLDAWAPKMKQGGILSGHDYDISAWPGVVKAVDEYVKAHPGEVAFSRPTRTVFEMRIK